MLRSDTDSRNVLIPLTCCLSCVDSDEVNQVVHSNDAFAPVAYLNLCKMHLEEKAAEQQVYVIVYQSCFHLSLT